ncbi:GNAT family N-acetyltransferase [uncultured Acetatifactor sp.]|uniref:GNAT family N-acetyltransferase n=1 Tax=uncultured Acetatifactor sp. TaxID=1671927 RepID=UPI002603B738|nr:GNAT family N-acetyltransferase [uncultured Acetatifactor sp.]
MVYLKEIEVETEGRRGVLYLTDDAGTARGLREAGEAVLIYLHPGNRDQDFSGFLFAVEDPEDLEPEYIERAYRRLKGLPWNILRTARCLIRETIPEDVESFYQIYSHPAITEYMEGLYPEVEEERQYVRDYIEKVYTFFGFGVWTVIERESGAVIGRAGFSYREGFDEPELGFIIGVPWQRRGYAEEVCRAVLAYGWSALEFRQVQALVEPENIPSVRLCEKLGFRKDENVNVGEKEYYRFIVSNPYRI